LPRAIGKRALASKELCAYREGRQRLGVGVVEENALFGEGVQVWRLAGRDALKDWLPTVVEADVVLAKAIQHDANDVHPLLSSVSSSQETT
jgi:hypothetical protein